MFNRKNRKNATYEEIYYEDYDEEEYYEDDKLAKYSSVLLKIQAAGIAIVTLYLFYINLLPFTYLLGVSGIFVLLWLFQYFLLHKSKSVVTGKRVFSVFLSTLTIGVITLVFWYLGGFMSFFSAISSLRQEYNVYTVRVLADSSMDDISDVEGKTIGISSTMPESDLTETKKNLAKKIGSESKTSASEDTDTLAAALLSGDRQVILFDEAMIDIIEENREGFTSKTKVLYTVKIPVESNRAGKRNINVTKDSFNILITGVDSEGEIADKDNSDVNILATVDPVKKKVLLTTTPRDYYVALRGDTSKMDKLTHAGSYGADCSMETISALYDTPVDFYIKVNFSSVEALVDALGGITVDCDSAFSASTRSGKKVSFTKGKNTLNGEEALAYSRERKSLSGGDRARGLHQQQVITAIIDKITSPSMLIKYNRVLNIIEKNTVTDLSSSQMSSLIKMQLKRPGSWDTESISVDGTNASRKVYSYKKRNVYVMIPDDDSVDDAKDKIEEYMK